MARKFSELRDKMSPEARARSEEKTKQMLAEIDCPKHEWTEGGRVSEPDADGRYRLKVWDGSVIDRGVPSKWSECGKCGSMHVAPLS